jgi:C4-dicarboxylate-specific signal transduction histidine kinase
MAVTTKSLAPCLSAVHEEQRQSRSGVRPGVLLIEFFDNLEHHTPRTLDVSLGTGWIEGVHPDDAQGCFDAFLLAFHAQKPFRMEYRLRRADGEYRWVIESGIPRYTGAGKFAGYIGSNIDITDLKRAAEERERLRQLVADLAHINRVSMMGELAASLAHELSSRSLPLP